jgi:hypothetical protein
VKIAAILLIAISIAGADSIPRIKDSIPKDSVRNPKMESAVHNQPGTDKHPAKVDSVPPRPRVVLGSPQRSVNSTTKHDSIEGQSNQVANSGKKIDSPWALIWVAVAAIAALIPALFGPAPIIAAFRWLNSRNRRGIPKAGAADQQPISTAPPQIITAATQRLPNPTAQQPIIQILDILYKRNSTVLTITNQGLAPARSAEVWASCGEVAQTTEVLQRIPGEPRHLGVIAPASVCTLNAPKEEDLHLPYFVYGRATYVDSFGVPHLDTFQCVITGIESGSWNFHSEGNSTTQQNERNST